MWIRNGTQLEKICSKTGDIYCDIIINDKSFIDRGHECITFYNQRDEIYTFDSCDTKHSALCQSSQEICHSPNNAQSGLSTAQSLSTGNQKGTSFLPISTQKMITSNLTSPIATLRPLTKLTNRPNE